MGGIISKGLRAAVTTGFGLLLASTAFAQTCSDKSPSGVNDCSYTPQNISDWQYEIPGPIKATADYFDEDGAKAEFLGTLNSNCPTCCNPGTLASEGNWEDTSTAWSPGIAGWSSKQLTYIVLGSPDAQGKCPLTPNYINTAIYRHRTASCQSEWGHSWDANGADFCYRPRRTGQLCFGHPIALPGATKVFREVDYASPRRGALDFIRYYRSDDFSYPSGYQGNLWAGLGVGWTHNYAGNLWVTSNSIWVRWRADAPQFFYPASSTSYPIELTAFRGDQQGRLVQLSANSYAYYTPTNLLVIFGEGWPAAVYDPSGWGVTLEYRAPGVSNIIEVSGRQLQIYYEDQAAHLTRVTDPAGKDIVYSYRPGPAGPDNIPATYSYTSLVGVTYEDHSSKQYVVGDWTPTSQILATKIMGVIDENGALYETVHYDAQGIAQSSELAGGVDKFVVSGTQVTDPLLTQRSYQFSQSAAAPSSVYQPAGSGCGASSSYKTYNADNTLLSEDDFDQHRICYAYDSKYREATRVEGLSTGVSCSSVLPSGSALPAGSRKTSTQWHPDWRLPSKVAEPGKITTDVYNNQPDPFKGGAVASCAPSSALLPDGKPIVVLCKRVEQATTDANGSQGFNAAMDTKVANRVWSYTYNQYGQVLTAKGPRTDVNDTTTYAYYPDTTSTHTLGDLQSVTDALGHTTNFTQYDPYGNVLEQVDVNQVVTDYTYDLRQRLKTVKVGSQSTSFDYWPTGLLKQVTWPDLSYVAYSYDDAHRLTDVSDSAGNSVHYVLDNAGNRTAEQYKDPSGTLKSELDRVYDALGRVQQTNGRE